MKNWVEVSGGDGVAVRFPGVAAFWDWSFLDEISLGAAGVLLRAVGS